MGKHVAPERQRPRLTRIVAVTVAVCLALVGGLLLLRQTAPTSSAASPADDTATLARDSSPAARAAVSAVPGIERLVVYGHSMPAGGGASAPSRGYPVLAAQQLGLELVNRAQGGTGAANATQTMEAAGPAGSQDAIVLHTGMNDIFRRGDAAVGRGRQAIRSFLDGTESAGRRVIVLECQPGSWSDTPPGVNLQSAYDAWNDMLRREARTRPDVEILDICEIWNPQRFTNVQKFHPNDEGHARMAIELADILTGA